MEYFTRKAHEAAQTPKGRKQWQQVEKQYATHLRSINPELKEGWRQLATDDFAGEAVRLIERPAFDQVIIELKEHMLIFRGVRQARLPEATSDIGTWLCHEVYVSAAGVLEVKALLSEGELRVTAEDVRIYRADVSASRVAA